MVTETSSSEVLLLAAVDKDLEGPQQLSAASAFLVPSLGRDLTTEEQTVMLPIPTDSQHQGLSNL